MKRLSLIALLSWVILGPIAPALADRDFDDDDWKDFYKHQRRVNSRPYYAPPPGYYYGRQNPNVYWAPGQWRRHRGLGARIANPYYYYYGR